VSLLAQPGSGKLGLELLDEQVVPVAQANGAEDVKHISFDGLRAGTYYLRVFGTDGGTNRYDLSLDMPLAAAPEQNLDDWTILVYTTASDLAPFAFADVNELELAASRLPGSVNLAVLWDQSSAVAPTYATGGGAQAAWGTTGRAIVVGDTDPLRVATPFDILPEQNTGDPATLQDFLQWGAAVAPARNYALVLWDHGTGLKGSNFDNADGEEATDHLTTGELVSALQSPSVPRMRLIAFDACLMGTAEVGYSLHELTDVFVASEEVVGGPGYDYSTLFQTLYTDPANVDAEQLATGFVRSFAGQYGATGTRSDTQSAFRSAGYDPLASALQAFVTVAETATPDELDVLRRARNAAVSYTYSYLRDLGDFLRAVVEDPAASPGLNAAAMQVRDALATMRVDRSSDVRRSSGVSVFLPADGSQIDSSYLDAYASFATASQWTDFLGLLGDSGADTAGSDGRAAVPDWAEPNNTRTAAYNLRSLSGRYVSLPGLNLGLTDEDWFRFTTLATGGAGNGVAVKFSAAPTNAIRLRVYNRNGDLLGEASGSGEQRISLSGRAAAEYYVSVTRVALGGAFTLTIDAPRARMAVDWAGNNSTEAKAYPLGLIESQAVCNGLIVGSEEDDWFTISTPRMAEPAQRVLTISVEPGRPVIAELYDAEQQLVSSASGSGLLELPYFRHAAETFTLHIADAAGDQDNTSYSLLFEIRPDLTLSDNRVTENVLGAPLGQLAVSDPDGGAWPTMKVDDDDRFEIVAGQLQLKAGQSLDFEAEPTVPVTVTATDTAGLSVSKTFTILVANVNEPPVAVSDAYATDGDNVLTVPATGVLGNDTDVDGQFLTVSQVNGLAANVGTQITLPSGALLTVGADGHLSYNPNGWFSRLDDGQTDSDTFVYTASDGTADSNPATVTVTITGVNDGPTILNLPAIYPLPQPGPGGFFIVEIPFEIDDAETPAQGLLVANLVTSNTDLVPQSVNGTDNLRVFGSGAQRTLLFAYDPNLGGQEATISFVVEDAGGKQTSAAVVFQLLAAGPFYENRLDPFDVDNSGKAPDAPKVSAVDVLLVINELNENGSHAFQQPNGNVTYFYDVDGDHWVKPQDVLAIIDRINNAPAAANDRGAAYTTTEATVLTVMAPGVLANDADPQGDPLTVATVDGRAANVGTQLTLASGALLTVGADGRVTYDPHGQFDGLTDGQTATEWFVYTVWDGTAYSNVATVTITITGVTAATSNGEGEGPGVPRAAVFDERAPSDFTVRERAVAALLDESSLRFDELDELVLDVAVQRHLW
jgi:VCBS repeat-containing protein